MQIYGLPQGNVADVGGAIEGGQNFKQRQELFKQAQRDLAAQRKQEQQQAKFKKLYAGVKAAEQSPGVLNVLARDFPEYASQAQELLQLAQTNPQGYQAKIRELQGTIQMQLGEIPAGQKPTNDILNWQFGQQNPGFLEQFGPGSTSQAKPPAMERYYQIHQEQARAAGKQPMPWDEYVSWYQKQQAGGRAEGTASVVSSADRVAAAAKRPRLQQARRDLDGIRDAGRDIDDNLPGLRGGLPLTGEVLKRLPAGQKLERYKASLLSHIAALTRIPGVGAQSDWEGRLQEIPLPSVDQFPEVRQDAIDQLELLVNDLEAAYDRVLVGDTSQLAPSSQGGEIDVASELRMAREAIANGIDQEWVKKQLEAKGIDPGLLE